MTWNVLTPRPLQEAAHEVLDDFAEVTVTTEYADGAALDADIDRFDAIVVKSLSLPRERLERATNLKLVTQSGVGLDPVDVDAATDLGVLVCNVRGANTRAVAEHTLAFVLAIRKGLRIADADVREGVWEKHGYLAPELEGDTLGVFGCGDVGSLVTRLAAGFGMRPIAYDPYKTSEELPGSVEAVGSVSELFGIADVVCLHAPLTDETRAVVGGAELRALGEDGILVNTARGGLVDHDALVSALASGTIHGAGIDVFPEEPAPEDDPLFDLENVVVTPHSAGSTLKSVPAKDRGAAENVRTVYEGRIPETTVNLDGVALRSAYRGEIPDHARGPDPF
ncbi:NAD(P)-dependent oxidoreductase [Salinirubellus sp. GCM10025818]|jgi:phosphoglycerate dehydrogenase-like enzyme|uniref:NAD(P)-dependent oxidoreductase n=1 Tax=Salinirubellus TaxID=2162630 RepID=UPI0030CF302A